MLKVISICLVATAAAGACTGSGAPNEADGSSPASETAATTLAETATTATTPVTVATSTMPPTSAVAPTTTVATTMPITTIADTVPVTSAAPQPGVPIPLSDSDWPDDFGDYWPKMDDVLVSLPGDWVAPAGWVEHDPSDIDPLGYRFNTVRLDYVGTDIDDRLLAFDFNTTYEVDYFGRHISEQMPTPGSIDQLADGAYTAQLVVWDREQPDRATFRVAPVMDCTLDGVFYEFDLWGDQMCGPDLVPGEVHRAEPTCGPERNLCVDIEVIFDDTFTVLVYGYVIGEAQGEYPRSVNTLGQGPELVNLLTQLYDDYVSVFVDNEAMGPDWIEREAVPGSSFINVMDTSGEDPYFYGQIFAWSRDGMPAITFGKPYDARWTDDPAAITPWAKIYTPAPDGLDVCTRWEIRRSGFIVEDDVDGQRVPCTVTEGIRPFPADIFTRSASFMRRDGRTAWTWDLPSATS
ncbi:MAG: hypothetical protein ACO38K_03875 [Ilumatobacteraceae bacterium]